MRRFDGTLAAIAALSPPQRDALDAAAMGEQPAAAARTMRSLVTAGYLEAVSGMMEFRDGLPPMRVTRYAVPIPVHIAWAQQCSIEYDALPESAKEALDDPGQ